MKYLLIHLKSYMHVCACVFLNVMLSNQFLCDVWSSTFTRGLRGSFKWTHERCSIAHIKTCCALRSTYTRSAGTLGAQSVGKSSFHFWTNIELVAVLRSTLKVSGTVSSAFLKKKKEKNKLKEIPCFWRTLLPSNGDRHVDCTKSWWIVEMPHMCSCLLSCCVICWTT